MSKPSEAAIRAIHAIENLQWDPLNESPQEFFDRTARIIDDHFSPAIENFKKAYQVILDWGSFEEDGSHAYWSELHGTCYLELADSLKAGLLELGISLKEEK